MNIKNNCVLYIQIANVFMIKYLLLELEENWKK